MKISNSNKCYVWSWLPNATQPIVCGKIEKQGQRYAFYYAPSYLNSEGAIPITASLPLTAEPFFPDHELHGVFRDALPDAWGQRILLYKYKMLSIPVLDMLLFSSSDRIGALHFQTDSNLFKPQFEDHASLKQLYEAVSMIEKGQSLPKNLELAIAHGTSVGGARPKALIEADNKKYIAKFSSSTDLYPIVKAECAAMKLAQYVGISVANVELTNLKGKFAILVERFDREAQENGWTRKMMLSALTLLGLDDMEGRYASYLDLADLIRKHSVDSAQQLRELFRRMVFNILVGNTDDHAKNHAFFWDGTNYELTPAYDICLFGRKGQEATQAMIVGEQGALSQLSNALTGVARFQLTKSQAREEVDQLVDGVKKYWPIAADEAQLTRREREQLTGSSILNPYCFYG